MWMNDRKSQVHPQKRAYMWMKGRKSQVHPQKQPYMWINDGVLLGEGLPMPLSSSLAKFAPFEPIAPI